MRIIKEFSLAVIIFAVLFTEVSYGAPITIKKIDINIDENKTIDGYSQEITPTDIRNFIDTILKDGLQCPIGKNDYATCNEIGGKLKQVLEQESNKSSVTILSLIGRKPKIENTKISIGDELIKTLTGKTFAERRDEAEDKIFRFIWEKLAWLTESEIFAYNQTNATYPINNIISSELKLIPEDGTNAPKTNKPATINFHDIAEKALNDAIKYSDENKMASIGRNAAEHFRNKFGSDICSYTGENSIICTLIKKSGEKMSDLINYLGKFIFTEDKWNKATINQKDLNEFENLPWIIEVHNIKGIPINKNYRMNIKYKLDNNEYKNFNISWENQKAKKDILIIWGY